MNGSAVNSKTDRKRKPASWIFIILLAAAVAADIMIVALRHTHGHLRMENLPGFGALAGLAAAVLIAAAAKLLGHLLVTRGEDYYD